MHLLRTIREKLFTAFKNRRTYFKTERVILVALVIAILVHIFVAQPFIVFGNSMVPTYNPGDYLVIDRLSYRFEPPQRGDAVVFRYPLDPSLYFIKRIDALPGETVEEATGNISVSSTQEKQIPTVNSPRTLTLASDEYFVLGDNSAESSDSRTWGPLQRKFIVGRAVFRLWPI